jgi:8-oxo-dGTP pyrophosphatase MutT (NUDIX family)
MIKPSPAATVAILRDSRDGLEILLLKRHQNLAFAANQWVFPGGRIELSDKLQHTDSPQLIARYAAIRETQEETGLSLTAKQLHHYANWTTPKGPARRFATWFFITQLNQTKASICVDGEEITDYCWFAPKHALQQHKQGLLPLMLPTFLTLTQLMVHSNAAQALSFFKDLTAHEHEPIITLDKQGNKVFTFSNTHNHVLTRVKRVNGIWQVC